MADVALQPVVVIDDPGSVPYVKRKISGAHVRDYTTPDHSAHLTVADVMLHQVFPWHRFPVGTEALRVMKGVCTVEIYGGEAYTLGVDRIISLNAGVIFRIIPLADNGSEPFVMLYAANGPSFSPKYVDFLTAADLAEIDAERARLAAEDPAVPFH